MLSNPAAIAALGALFGMLATAGGFWNATRGRQQGNTMAIIAVYDRLIVTLNSEVAWRDRRITELEAEVATLQHRKGTGAP